MTLFTRFFAACLLALALGLPSQAQEAADATPRLLLKVNARHAAALRVQDGQTQIAALDAVSRRFNVAALRRVLPQSSKFGARHREAQLDRWISVRLPAGTNVQAALDAFRASGVIEVAEQARTYSLDVVRDGRPVDATFSALSLLATTNDPRFAEQWHYNNTGQGGGRADADIDLPEAWDLNRGNPNVVVAVMDTGADLDHPDLQGNLWRNPGEIAGNGVDDDRNGYVDDIHGFDFSNNDNNPDDNIFSLLGGGHGSHTAGTISAVTNNAVGVAGVAGGTGSGNGVRIMVAKIFNNAFDDVIAEAFTYAADNGAVISSNSWGGDAPSQIIRDAINYFITNAGGPGQPLQGGLVVVSAGNDNNNKLKYPASYEEVLSVASSDRNDVRSSFSTYGTTVDITAPGSDVLSTTQNKGYAVFSGTSMACPHVSGVAALVVSQNPNLTAAQLRQILLTNVDDIYARNPSFTGQLGSGRLNAFKALEAAGNNGGGDPTGAEPEVDLTPSGTPTLPTGGGRVRFTATFSNTGDAPYSGVYWVTRTAPNGTTTTLSGPTAITLSPGASQSVNGSDRLRRRDDNGTYTYAANLGPNTATVDATDSFTATKGASSRGSNGALLANAVPETFRLEEAYPNPFNPATQITFGLPEAAGVRLAVYDVTGREVAVLADGTFEAGTHTVTLNAGALSSGVYVYRIVAGANVASRTVVLMK